MVDFVIKLNFTTNRSMINFQGRIIPCDFIGVVKSQQPVYLKGYLS